MKGILFILCLTLVGLVNPLMVHAAFPVKHATELSSTKEASGPVISLPDHAAHAHSLRKMEARVLHWLHPNRDKYNPDDSRPGWPGLVSIICGLAFFLFPLSSIAAIVFGIIGLNRRYKNHGMALTGLILGSLEIIGFVILFIAIINAFKGFTLNVI